MEKKNKKKGTFVTCIYRIVMLINAEHELLKLHKFHYIKKDRSLVLCQTISNHYLSKLRCIVRSSVYNLSSRA